jgi:hypothetical protein
MTLDLGFRADRAIRLRPLRPVAGLSADKYKALEHRRRQAQIAARRLLDLTEGN